MNQPSLEKRLQCRERPHKRPLLLQQWHDLLWLHWPMDVGVVQKSLPKGLTVDTFDGKAFVGIIPLFIKGTRPTFLPSVSWLSDFMELNVRTYVFDESGTPGVYFYSLDCPQPLAVHGARMTFHLKYEHARMSFDHAPNDFIRYNSQRKGRNTIPSRFEYLPCGPSLQVAPGSIDFFVLERYYLFSANSKGKLFRAQVHHAPYLVSSAKIPVWDARYLEINGFTKSESAPELIHYCLRVNVEIYPLEKI